MYEITKSDKKSLLWTGVIVLSVSSLFMLFFGGKKVKEILRGKRMTKVIDKWGDKIKKYALLYDLEPHWLASLVCQESNGDSNAYKYEKDFYTRYIKGNSDWESHPYYDSPRIISVSYGLCQLMYCTAYNIASPELRREMTKDYKILYDPDVNLLLGAKYLKWCYDNCGKDIRKALAGYNAGGIAKNYCVPGDRGYGYADKVTALYDSTTQDIWELVA